jgi:hypothetical protein
MVQYGIQLANSQVACYVNKPQHRWINPQKAIRRLSLFRGIVGGLLLDYAQHEVIF